MLSKDVIFKTELCQSLRNRIVCAVSLLFKHSSCYFSVSFTQNSKRIQILFTTKFNQWVFLGFIFYRCPNSTTQSIKFIYLVLCVHVTLIAHPKQLMFWTCRSFHHQSLPLTLPDVHTKKSCFSVSYLIFLG